MFSIPISRENGSLSSFKVGCSETQMTNFPLGCGRKGTQSMEQAVGWDCRGTALQRLQNAFACIACSRAVKSHAGNCLQLHQKDQCPSAVGWRGEPGSLELSLPSPSQLCPFSLSLSFALQKWLGLLSLGRKDHIFLCFRRIWNFVCKT